MKFALVLLAVCAHDCDGAVHSAAGRTFSSFHECFIAGFSAARREDRKGQANVKFKCVLQAEPQPKEAKLVHRGEELQTPQRPLAWKLIERESGGRPALVNKFGYAGLFQFGAPLLKDLGVYSPGPSESLASWSRTQRDARGKWSGTFAVPGYPNVTSLSEFLATPEAQKAVFLMHRARMDQQIWSRGFEKYIGSRIAGIPITVASMEFMIHLGGPGGTERVLRSGGRINPVDAYGTSLLDYARLGSSVGKEAAWENANRPTVDVRTTDTLVAP
jgi:hypothetical protein